MKRASKAIRWTLTVLSSGSLTVWLVTSWLVYYVTLAMWAEEAFATFAALMGESRAFQFLYVTFLVNIVLRMGRYIRSGWSRAYFRTFSRAVTFCGVLLVLTGFFVSMVTKQAIRPLVGQDDVLRTPWDPNTGYVIEKIIPRLQSSFLDIEEGSGWFAYEPRMLISREGDREVVGAFPPSRFGRTWMHILQCGLGPGLRLLRDEHTVREGYAALRLLPPGGTDYLEFDRSPYRFMLKLLPKTVIRKGDLEAGLYDLENPLYEIRVFRGDESILRARSDEVIEFDGLRLEMLPTEYWALLDVVRDDGILPVAGGFLMTGLGVGLVLLWGIAVLIKRVMGAQGSWETL